MAVPSSSTPLAYGVRVTFDRDQEINRVWGIPLFGALARILVLVPHLFVVWVLGLVSGLTVFVTWIPVLVLGRMPGWAIDFYELTYRWYVRVAAYALLLVDAYPPFSSDAPYPVDVTVDAPREINRLWGIPFLGLWVRGLVVIPHAILLFFLGIGVGFGVLVSWIPILLNGRMPALGYDLFGGYLRLTTRVAIWTLLVPIPYPPIRIAD